MFHFRQCRYTDRPQNSVWLSLKHTRPPSLPRIINGFYLQVADVIRVTVIVTMIL